MARTRTTYNTSFPAATELQRSSGEFAAKEIHGRWARSTAMPSPSPSRPAFIVRDDGPETNSSAARGITGPEDGSEMGRRMGAGDNPPKAVSTEVGTEGTVCDLGDPGESDAVAKKKKAQNRVKLIVVLFVLLIAMVSGVVLGVLFGLGDKTKPSNTTEDVVSGIGDDFSQCVKDNDCDNGDICVYYSLICRHKSCCEELTAVG